MLGAVVLVAVNAVLERVAGRYKWLDRIVEGRPTAVVIDGHTDGAALRRLGMNHYELHSALRHQGADAIHEVKSPRSRPAARSPSTSRPTTRTRAKVSSRQGRRGARYSYIDARAR